MKYVCIGDSLTYGYGVRRGRIWTAHLNRICPQDAVLNKGISGDTSGGMLARFDTDAVRARPDVVCIMGGSNDIFLAGDFKQVKCNLSAMIFRCLHEQIIPVIGIPVPVYTAGLTDAWRFFAGRADINGLIAEYRNWIIEFSSIYSIAVLDFYSAVQTSDTEIHNWYLDGVHMNEDGHRLMAEVFMEAVQARKW